jgi:hypothetical protein
MAAVQVGTAPAVPPGGLPVELVEPAGLDGALVDEVLEPLDDELLEDEEPLDGDELDVAPAPVVGSSLLQPVRAAAAATSAATPTAARARCVVPITPPGLRLAAEATTALRSSTLADAGVVRPVGAGPGKEQPADLPAERAAGDAQGTTCAIRGLRWNCWDCARAPSKQPRMR